MAIARRARAALGLPRDLLVGDYGLVTMALTYALALVLPIVATFFIAFGVLEDSGYLPRLAVMVNRAFKTMGLNGKAVLPMVLGLGCDTMATLTTRILETRKERVIVILLLALGVPCSAQLASSCSALLPAISPLASAGLSCWRSCSLGRLAARVIPGARQRLRPRAAAAALAAARQHAGQDAGAASSGTSRRRSRSSCWAR